MICYNYLPLFMFCHNYPTLTLIQPYSNHHLGVRPVYGQTMTARNVPLWLEVLASDPGKAPFAGPTRQQLRLGLGWKRNEVPVPFFAHYPKH